MNADCESELARLPDRYFRPASFDAINRRLAEHLLLLATAGDALLIAEPWSAELRRDAARRDVELIAPDRVAGRSHKRFTPWGWTPGAIRIGERAGAIVDPIPPEIVRRVSSKLWSFELEQELGVVLPGSGVAHTFDELREMIAASFPGAESKWVIKSLFGFAARDRVLGRGAQIGAAQGAWARKVFARGEPLIVQPWLDVTREYGVACVLDPDGTISFVGISDLQTNGAGTGTGYMLGRPVAPERERELRGIAGLVGRRLHAAGYAGAFGVDALEHANGFHPLLEVNARYTMGFVALAAERELAPRTPVLWRVK